MHFTLTGEKLKLFSLKNNEIYFLGLTLKDILTFLGLC